MLRQLPRDLVEAFPAMILPYSAVDRRILVRIEQTPETKKGFQTLANQIEEAHKAEFHQGELR